MVYLWYTVFFTFVVYCIFHKAARMLYEKYSTVLQTVMLVIWYFCTCVCLCVHVCVHMFVRACVCVNKVQFCLLYVTQHEKIGLMYT